MISWSQIGNGWWLDVFIICKTKDAFYDPLCNKLCSFRQDFAVEIKEPRFDDCSDGVRVNFTEGMIFAHVAGDASSVEGHTGDMLIAIHQTGSMAIGTIEIASVERRSDFEAGC